MRTFLFFGLLLFLLSGCVVQAPRGNQVSNSPAQNPLREFRGVWVSTVANLDFPSSALLTSQQQREEFRELAQNAQAMGLNTLMVQVRASGDAFYPSRITPWSAYLSGEKGQAPAPFYDPLAFMIEETHRQGMHFHAWFNPFRWVFSAKKITPEEQAWIDAHPDWTFNYAGKVLLNPGHPEARKLAIHQITEVVERYDLEAIHLDDYFYPYPKAGDSIPDYVLYDSLGAGFERIEDWRRQQVNTFMHDLAEAVREIKPEVKIGVSPFGVWRNQSDDPRGSATSAGLRCYDELYADVRLWMQRGWVDYVIPQLYFSLGHPAVDFETLAKWWGQNSFGKHVYLGHAAYKSRNSHDLARKDPRWGDAAQIPKQIRLARSLEGVQGSAFFRYEHLATNLGGLRDSLTQHFYNTPALPPAYAPPSYAAPDAPRYLTALGCRKGAILHWDKPLSEKVAFFAVYRYPAQVTPDPAKSRYLLSVCPSDQAFFIDQSAESGKAYQYQVLPLDASGREGYPSMPVFFKFKKKFLRR